MIKATRLLTIIGTFFFFFSVQAADAFLPGTEDIPLMPGLIIDITDNMDFDTPAGQIITLEGTAKKLNASDIYTFYQSALPTMGWKEVQKGYFKREKDSLRLTVLSTQKPIRIQFEISLTSGF